MKKISIPNDLKHLASIFNKKNFQVYLVGGAVRDSVLGKTPRDWDVATDATPAEMQKIFYKTIPTGIEHGTITIVFKGKLIEATTFRAETVYSDGRHPDDVVFSKSIYEDLSRRDFTMNAIAAKLPTGELVDPFNGIEDIKNKIIRTVGNPNERFSEDALRPLRGIRFAAQLGFKLEDATKDALAFVLPKADKLAKERVREEFSKILTSSCPSLGLKLMETSGYLQKFLPDLFACKNILQGGFHSFDVLEHLFYTTDGVSSDYLYTPDFATSKSDSLLTDLLVEKKTTDNRLLIVRLAALFHDVGKPAVQKEIIGENRFSFYNHEFVSYKLAEKILTKFRYPSILIKDVCALIKFHMFYFEENWTDSAVRRFLSKLTEVTRSDRTLDDILNDLFELRRGDLFGMKGVSSLSESLIAFRERIQKIRDEQSAFSIKDLAVSGKDLIESGIPAGKSMGQILQELLNTVLASPTLNTKEKLLEIAKNYYVTNFL